MNRGSVVRTVYTSVRGEPVSTTLLAHQPFRDDLVLIAGKKDGHIHRGNVLVRNRQLAKKLGVPVAYIVFKGLRDARRAYDFHARDTYVAEIDLLDALTAEELPEVIVRTFRLAGVSEAQKRMWARDVGAIADKLKGDHDPKKAMARLKLLRAADIHDILGRSNPSAARARTMAGLSRLRDRQEDVPGLDAHRAKIAAQLNVINLRAMAMAFNLEQEVGRVILRVNEAWRGKNVNLLALARSLANEARHFASKDVNPYGPHAFKQFAKDLAIIATHLRAKRVSLAVYQLDILARSILLLREHEAIDAALTGVSRIKRGGGKFRADDRRIILKIIASVRDFLAKHPGIDDGFRRPVATNLRQEISRAYAAVETNDVDAAYHALSAAACCI